MRKTPMLATLPAAERPVTDKIDGDGQVLSPDRWTASLSAPSHIDSRRTAWSGAHIELWHGIDPTSYPALDHHCLTMHLGMPRRIVRRGGGRQLQVGIRPGALSLTPAGEVYEWQTNGPVDYAEVYISPAMLQQLAIEEADARPVVAIRDRLGAVDPLTEALFRALLEELSPLGGCSKLLLDQLFQTLCLRLLRLCAGAGEQAISRPTLQPARLRRVLDFVEANLAADIGIADLAASAALSPNHFSHAFANATGLSPYAYLIVRRMDVARRLLANPQTSLSSVAASVGFRSTGQFSRMFKSHVGTTPGRYRSRL